MSTQYWEEELETMSREKLQELHELGENQYL